MAEDWNDSGRLAAEGAVWNPLPRVCTLPSQSLEGCRHAREGNPDDFATGTRQVMLEKHRPDGAISGMSTAPVWLLLGSGPRLPVGKGSTVTMHSFTVHSWISMCGVLEGASLGPLFSPLSPRCCLTTAMSNLLEEFEGRSEQRRSLECGVCDAVAKCGIHLS